MKHQFRKLNFWLVLLIDLLLLVAVHLLAYGIRFEGTAIPPEQMANLKTVLPLLVPIKLLLFQFFGLYRGMWRYTSLIDLLNILKACLAAGLISVGGLLFVNRFEGFSRAVFLLDILLTFLFIAGFRVGLRLFFQAAPGLPFLRDDTKKSRHRKRLLIIGAGDAAEKVAREILENRALPYRVVGFLDDHPGKIGQRIHGIPVLGPIADLEAYVLKTSAQEILIAIPSANRDQMRRIVEICRSLETPFKTLPGLGELISDRVSVRAIRDVSYRDLLGRPPVRLELARIGELLAGRVVLVTGAGGSIGSELCRQIIRFGPKNLLLLDAAEQNLYQVEMELRHECGFSDYLAVLGSVQDESLLERLFSRYRPTMVFHAAAYKHVPMVERNPWEGISNNVLASSSLMEMAVRFEVERFILISTDKAVRPTNVMGASKRLTELIMLSHSENALPGTCKTRFMAVRFGNVLGSSGSVIPLFRRQIEMGGPVTVTHPDMTRYFMSIEEATQLILQATTMGSGGEIFILEMGTPVRIEQMARDLIRLCGKEPDTEIEIRYTGLRPGEKMYEELITEGEGIVATGHEKIMVLRGAGPAAPELRESLIRLKDCAARHDAGGIKRELARLIPEYSPQETESVLL